MTILLVLIAVLLLLVLAALYICTWHPPKLMSEKIVYRRDTPLLKAGQTLKVMTWNIQFLAGNEDNHFFFDGGTDDWPERPVLEKVGRQIADIIKDEDPDIVMLQELDERASRTHYMRQLDFLLDKLPSAYSCHTSSYYWKALFMPHPAVMGRVGMKMTTLSKYKIASAKRHALSAIRPSNWLARQFNTRRCALAATLPIEGGGDLKAINVHLEVFGQGTDTLQRQVNEVSTLFADHQSDNNTAVMGGDFNLLPTDHAYQEQSAYCQAYFNPNGTEISPLMTRYQSVPSLEDCDGENRRDFYTHTSNHIPEKSLDKTLDYLFVGDDLTMEETGIRQHDTIPVSDHMPIMATVRLP